MSKTTNKFSPEVRQRAVRLVLDHEHERVKKVERDIGVRAGVPTDVVTKLKALEAENHELWQANEILRKASACSTQAELDGWHCNLLCISQAVVVTRIDLDCSFTSPP